MSTVVVCNVQKKINTSVIQNKSAKPPKNPLYKFVFQRFEFPFDKIRK